MPVRCQISCCPSVGNKKLRAWGSDNSNLSIENNSHLIGNKSPRVTVVM